MKVFPTRRICITYNRIIERLFAPMDKKPKEENEMAQETIEYYDSGFPKVMNRNKFDLSVNGRLKEARNRRGYSLAKVKNLLALQGTPTGRSTIQGYEA